MRLAESLPRRVRKGHFYRVRGHQVFKAINSVLMLLGRPPRTDAPEQPKFGVPPPNTRVFIRTWQVVDGWENRGQMQLTNALVPTR